MIENQPVMPECAYWLSKMINWTIKTDRTVAIITIIITEDASLCPNVSLYIFLIIQLDRCCTPAKASISAIVAISVAMLFYFSNFLFGP